MHTLQLVAEEIGELFGVTILVWASLDLLAFHSLTPGAASSSSSGA